VLGLIFIDELKCLMLILFHIYLAMVQRPIRIIDFHYHFANYDHALLTFWKTGA